MGWVILLSWERYPRIGRVGRGLMVIYFPFLHLG